MAEVKIGELVLAVGAPDVELLLASTGYSPAAMRDLLKGPVMAGTVAAALLACMTAEELPQRHELACLIANDDVHAVREKVRRLYARRKKGPADGQVQD